MLQLHSQVLGFSQWCLVYGEFLVCLLMRETEVRNDLCHHLSDVTLSIFSAVRIALGPYQQLIFLE